MKFSFQTICLVFLVTAVHLAAVAAIRAIGGETESLFPEIDRGAIVEDLMTDEPEGVGNAESGEDTEESEPTLGESASTSIQEPGPGDEVGPENKRDNPVESENEPSLVEAKEEEWVPKTALEAVLGPNGGKDESEDSETERPALAEARLLVDRIEAPDIEQYVPRGASQTRKPVPAEKPAVIRASPVERAPVATSPVATSPVATSPVATSPEGRYRIRSIRPIPDS